MVNPGSEASWSETSSGSDIQDEVASLKSVLVELFGETQLSLLEKKRYHPAARIWTRLCRLEAAPVIDYEEEWPAIRSLSEITLDRLTWSRARRAATSSVITDEAWRQVRTRVLDQDQYPDVLAELYVWGYLASTVENVKLIQEDGRADILIDGAEPIACEVKRIRRGSSVKRIREVMGKANKQVKTTTPGCSGILFILLDRDPERASLDDRVPSDVDVYLQELRRHLHATVFRSLACVVMAWDEIEVNGSLSDAHSVYTVLRKSVRVDHPASLTSPDIHFQRIGLGIAQSRTLGYGRDAVVELPAIPSSTTSYTEEFRAFGERNLGIRPQQIAEVLANPTGRYSMEIGDEAEITVVTRDVTRGTLAHRLLVVASVKRAAESTTTVIRGYKLWPLSKLPPAEDAFASFIWLLESFGVDVGSGNVQGRFLPHVRVYGSGSLDVLKICNQPEPEPHSTLRATGFIKLMEDPQRYVEVRFAFCVDETRLGREYRRYIGILARQPGQRHQPKRLSRRQRQETATRKRRSGS